MQMRGGRRSRSVIRAHRAARRAGVYVRNFSGAVVLATGLIALSGCQETRTLGPLTHQSPATELQPSAPGAAATKAPEVANTPPVIPAAKPQVFSGGGVFVNPTPSAPSGGPEAQAPAGDITLNFVDTDVREVLPRVLGDVLHLNFTIDPKVQATITI